METSGRRGSSTRARGRGGWRETSVGGWEGEKSRKEISRKKAWKSKE